MNKLKNLDRQQTHINKLRAKTKQNWKKVWEREKTRKTGETQLNENFTSLLLNFLESFAKKEFIIFD